MRPPSPAAFTFAHGLLNLSALEDAMRVLQYAGCAALDL